MRLYVGSDLHSTNSVIGIVDETGKRIRSKKIPNAVEAVLKTFEPYKEKIEGISVESTFNWYWYVNALEDAGYKVHLANPCAIQKYSGMKNSNDKHDAFWLAEMLRLKILPKGYIYPRQDRPVRDLLRKRSHLVRSRTSLILSLQNILSRNYGYKISANDISKKGGDNRILHIEWDAEEHAMAVHVSKECIDLLSVKIREIEKMVLGKARLREPFKYLLTIPGVGNILALTIMYETGFIDRFKKPGNYVSYCRKVSSKWTSNGKAKGKGNKKNGNKYLAWAYSEAAGFARRYDERVRAWYNRKLARTNSMVAQTALAAKFARAAWYIMKYRVPYEPERLFDNKPAGAGNQ